MRFPGVDHPFNVSVEWKRLYRHSSDLLLPSLQLHKNTRALLKLDLPDNHFSLLEAFYRGDAPNQDGHYMSMVPCVRILILRISQILSPLPPFRFATPLWFRFDETEKGWMWTPDQQNWMPITTDIVRSGLWRGQRPVPKNRTLLSILTHYKLTPLGIFCDFHFYPSRKFFRYVEQSPLPPLARHFSSEEPDNANSAAPFFSEFEDVFVSVLEWLDPASHGSASQVCSLWERLIAENKRRLCRIMCNELRLV